MWPDFYNSNQPYNYTHYLIIILLLFSLKLRFAQQLSRIDSLLSSDPTSWDLSEMKRQKPCHCLLDRSSGEMGLGVQFSCYFFHAPLPECQAPSLCQVIWGLGHCNNSSCTRTWLTCNPRDIRVIFPLHYSMQEFQGEHFSLSCFGDDTNRVPFGAWQMQIFN